MLTTSSGVGGADAGGMVAGELSATKTHLCPGGTTEFWLGTRGVDDAVGAGAGATFPKG